MGDDFIPSLSSQANTLKIIAINKEGKESEPFTLHPYVLLLPNWLSFFGFLKFGGIKNPSYSLSHKYPKEPWKTDPPIIVPEVIPYVGGKEFGIKDTQAELKLKVELIGKGDVTLGGQTGLLVAGNDLGGKVKGTGNINYNMSRGLYWGGADFHLSINGTLSKDWKILDLIPPLAAYSNLPLVSWFNETAKIEASMTPEVDLGLYLEDKEGEIVFARVEGTDSLALKGSLIVGKKPLEARADVGGSGAATLQVPANPSYIKEVLFKVFAGCKLKIWLLIDRKIEKSYFSKYNGATGHWEVGSESKSLKEFKGFHFEPIPTEFLNRGPYSVFVANKKPRISSTNRSLSTTEIIENIYPYSEPVMAEANAKLVLCFVYYDPTDPSVQSTDIYYTTFNGTIWSTPKPILDDARAEFDPQLAVDKNGHIVAAWQRIKDENFNSTEIDQMASQMEIVYSVYDPEKDIWSAPAALTDNQYLDGNPLLTSDSQGNVLLVFESNQGNALLGNSQSPSDFLFATWNGTTWSNSVTILSNQANTFGYNMAAGNSGTTAGTLTWTRDTDGDFSTQEDQEIFYLSYDGTSWNTPGQLTDNSLSDHTPKAVYDGQGNLRITWIHDGQLVLLDDLSTGGYRPVREESGSAQFLDYKLTVNNQGDLAVLWQGIDELGNDIFYILYDADHDHWSKDIRLTQDNDLENSYLPFFSSSGDLMMAYNKDLTEYVTKTVQIDDQKIVIDNVPQSGRNDLHVLRYTLSHDLEILPEGITFSNPNPMPVDRIIITASISNKGDLSLDGVKVGFYHHNPYQGGTPICSLQTLTEPLGAGESKTVSVEWDIPAGAGSQEVYVLVDPMDDIPEKNESNNIASKATLLAELLIPEGEATPRGTFQDIVVSVKNEGSTPALNIPLEYRLGSKDGEIIGSQIIPCLGMNETIEQVLSWDTLNIQNTDYPDGQVSVYVTIDPDNSILEQDKENNTKAILIPDTTPPAITCPADITVSQASQDGAAVEFTCTATDNLDHNPTIVCDPPSGSIFPLGETIVSCTATDDYGNPATCTFMVTVEEALSSTTGFVFNHATGKPLPAARVTIKDVASSPTGLNGAYQLKEITPGAHNLDFRKKGFRTNILSGIYYTPGRELKINTALSPTKNTTVAKFSGTSSIRGFIYNKATGAPLKGVRVMIVGYGQRTTDASGFYQHLDVPSGVYTIKVTKPGFRQMVLKNILFLGNKPLEIDLGMTSLK